MAIVATYHKKVFNFNFKARTSRGLMRDKTSWFIKVEESSYPGVFGFGECGPLPGLSADDKPGYEDALAKILTDINTKPLHADIDALVNRVVPPEFPSITFGLETALLDHRNGGNRVIFKNSFTAGTPIPINGLIWMGDMDFMMDQINKKVAEGFRCLKLKVGGLDFDRECDILGYIRKKYFRENILIRLDANGAFKADDVLYKLEELARFQVHSIEQPIKPGLGEMEEICRKSPIPVAFDEELIGIMSGGAKIRMLEKLRPQFIVLKPTLHGGMHGCAEWITLAESRKVGWWITSALESSIGLNAICQFTANYDPIVPQGLGTGGIYENNIRAPLTVKDGSISYDESEQWDDHFA